MRMTTALLAAAALVMTAGTSFAAPGKHDGNRYGAGKNFGYSKQVHNRGKHVNHRGVTRSERAMIARSASSLAALKKRAWRDGRLTFSERAQIRNAERRHAALVSRAYRS